MGLEASDRIPEAIALEAAYSRIREWYKGALKVPGTHHAVAEESRALIEALPSADEASDVEMRAVLAEVIAGRLEWGYHQAEGSYKMAAYALGALGGKDCDYHLTSEDLEMLRHSPLWPLLKPVTNAQ